MPKSPSHLHRLRKHKYKTGNVVYFCTLPDCHYKIDAALVLGKRSMCNICGNEFIITEYTTRLKLPHCDACGKVRIIDSEGNKRFVKKVANQVLPNIATGISTDLRSRLDAVAGAELEDELL